MNQLIDNIIVELKVKHGLTKYEIEKIIDSQFKFTLEHIARRDLRPIKWMHLGKIKVSDYYEHKVKRDEKLAKKV